MDGTSELKRLPPDGNPDDGDTEKGKYMTFRSGTENYGVAIQYVNEIIQMQEITSVPETEDYIKGLINLRGKVVPVIDVRLRFKQAPQEYNDRTCIIVVNVKSWVVGLIVEEISGVVEINEENILPPPKVGHGEREQNKYVYGIGKVDNSVKLLLDPEKLLNDEGTSSTASEKEINVDEEGEV